MANIIHRPGWFLSERCVTPEGIFHNRRQFLKQLGFAGGGLLASALTGCNRSETSVQLAAPDAQISVPLPKGYPAPRNAEFNPGWRLTNEKDTNTYNNFYEFSLNKDAFKYVGKFVTAPWPVEISGLIQTPMTVDAAELAAMFDLEERVYRFRCVEAWAMIVPWTGFPLSKLLEKVRPKPEAKFVRFQSFYRPKEAPGQLDTSYPWPYTEGLRLGEAMNELTLVTTGIYGKPLPKQNGAPIRIVVPWKYGYKS